MYECSKLIIPAVRQEFKLELRNRFSYLMDDRDRQATVDCWNEGKKIYSLT